MTNLLTVALAVFVLMTLSWLFEIGSKFPVPPPTIYQASLPIVSIYVPKTNRSTSCDPGYELVSLSEGATLDTVSGGHCGCPLTSLSAVPSIHWRHSRICIKRGGIPVSEPDASSDFQKAVQCPTGYKKCGTGVYEEQTICFPGDSQCPITNMVVVNANETAGGWESAGAFHDNAALYVRRQERREKPIFDVLARLSELSDTNKSIRGPCYRGTSQALHQPLIMDTKQSGSYTVQYPPKCDIVDPRYHLFDSVDLESHFLQNLQSVEPTCELYTLSDHRYESESTLDPDYLNSTVKCGNNMLLSTSHACDDWKHRNVCSTYAHAIRSAFGNTKVKMGLYFARERSYQVACRGSLDFNYSGQFYLFILTLLHFLALCWWFIVCVCIFCEYSKRTIGLHCRVTVVWLCLSLWWLSWICVFSWSSLQYTDIVVPTSIPTIDCLDAYKLMGLEKFNPCLYMTVLSLFLIAIMDQFSLRTTPKKVRPPPTTESINLLV